MDGGVVVLVVVGFLAVLCLAALVLRGNFTGRARVPGGEVAMSVRSHRHSERTGARARIENSTSRSGSALASSSGDAEIAGTEVEGDLVASAGGEQLSDPKEQDET